MVCVKATIPNRLCEINLWNKLLAWWKVKEKIIFFKNITHSNIKFISYLSTTFLSASSLNIINIINPNDKMADPPLLKKGSGIPITGANPITIATLIIKWKNNKKKKVKAKTKK